MKRHLFFTTVALICAIFSQAQTVDSTKIKKAESFMQKGETFFTTGNVDSILFYYNKALKYAQTEKLYEQSTAAYHSTAKLYLAMGLQDSALVYFTKAADEARSHNVWLGLNKALTQSASICYSIGKNDQGIVFAKEAIEAGKKAEYDRGIAIGYVQAGNIFQNLARNEEALQAYQDASKYFEKIDFKAGVGTCLINIAGIYYTLESFDLSLEYDRKAIEVQKELGNMGEVANVMQNMSAIYSGYNRKNVITKYQHLDSAFYYRNEAGKIYEELKDSLNITKNTTNTGLLYTMTQEWDKAKACFDKAYPIALRKNYFAEIIAIENGYALMYHKIGKYDKAKEFFLKEYPRIKEGNYTEKECMWFKDFACTLDSLGDYENALRHYEQYVTMQDTLRGQEMLRQMNQLSARFGSEMKDKEIAQAKERQAFMQKEQDALQLRNRIMTGAAIIIAIFLIFVIYLFMKSQKLNKKIREQNDQLASKNDEISKQNEEITQQKAEIERQKDEVTAQKEQIEIQQESIMDSIHYASRIQTAILPRTELVEDLFADHKFILFKPRDIVSGDYYWIGRKANWKIAVAADCTGHGVPGAFMSMLGTAGLNEIINDPTMTDIHAGEILDKLRTHIIKSLKQTGAAGEQKDGMDLAMWMFDDESKMVRYAGANNPLIIVRKDYVEGEVEENDRIKIQEFVSDTNGETYHIIQVAGNKQPIAIYPEMVPFDEICIQLKTGDTLYTFSDGFQDQFGGPKGKKFMIKKLKQVFVNIYESPMEEQKKLLDHELVEWIESGETEQIDDVLVIGFRV
ncbi:MAG: SpoIIE family protein phosphatase [Bacteroidales bacterium]|nr:SpoIIE family protein phosphatase [Bacteroidales bacterium]